METSNCVPAKKFETIDKLSFWYGSRNSLICNVYHVGKFNLSVRAASDPIRPLEQRRKPGSDLVLVLISFRDGFRGSFARAVLAFAATFVS